MYMLQINAKLSLVHLFFDLQPFRRQPHKIVKHTQPIRWQLADKLVGCIWSFFVVGA